MALQRTLGLVATLVAVIAFDIPSHFTVTARISAGTDNLGNVFAICRRLTTKHPLNVALTELACQLQARGCSLHVHWTPRLQNKLADALNNGDFFAFSPEKRIRVNLSKFEEVVFRDLIETGSLLYEEMR